MQAMESAQAQLVDPVNHLVRLFAPPLDHSEPHPGYIMGYPPGLREKGGQYTHGSLWMAMAWARLGHGDRAAGLLTMMNPAERTRTREGLAKYCGEPLCRHAADVSSAPGRMGWSAGPVTPVRPPGCTESGSEEVLGFKLQAGTLSIRPVIPADWHGFELSYRYGSARYNVRVERDPELPSVKLHLDDAPIEGGTVSLFDDGAVHNLLVQIPVDQECSTPR